MGRLAELFEVQDVEPSCGDALYKEVIEKGLAPLTDDEKKEVIKLVESSRGLAYHMGMWARLAVIEAKLKRAWIGTS
jgi:hypothetical protein